MESETKQPKDEVLLAEYQAAQASGEHHDNLVWTVTSILWAASFVFLGFIVGNLDNIKLRPIFTIASILGLVLMAAGWFMAGQFNWIKRRKYKRCKEIEKIFGMTQHDLPEYKPGLQRCIYGVIMVLFIAVWLIILWRVWCGACI